MNSCVKNRWLEALRSGEYRQTRTELTDGNGAYCPLGLLCQLYVEEYQLPDFNACREFEQGGYFLGDVLPPRVRKWAGLYSSNPLVDGWPLAMHNDGSERNGIRALPFPEIADLIEVDL